MENIRIQKLYDDFVRRKMKYTNCYFTSGQLQEECARKKYSIEIIEGSLLIGIQEDGYTKLYFTGDDFNWTKVFHVPENEVVTIEVVTKGVPGEYDFSRKMKCNEVIQYTRFRRSGLSAHDKFPEVSAEFCSPDDFPEIRRMLDAYFSAIGDRIPGDAEIGTLIQNRSVICLRDGTGLKGYLIFEDKGKTSYIRNVCIKPEYRGKGAGKELMSAYFYIHRDFKGFTLWCKTTNEPAINLYTKWGGTAMRTSTIIFTYAEAEMKSGQEAA